MRLQGSEIMPTAVERVGVYRQLVSFMKEYFYDDDLGKKRAMYFLPWHLNFLSRYRPLPAKIYDPISSPDAPRLHVRHASIADHLVCFGCDKMNACCYKKTHAIKKWQACTAVDQDAFMSSSVRRWAKP